MRSFSRFNSSLFNLKTIQFADKYEPDESILVTTRHFEINKNISMVKVTPQFKLKMHNHKYLANKLKLSKYFQHSTFTIAFGIPADIVQFKVSSIVERTLFVKHKPPSGHTVFSRHFT